MPGSPGSLPCPVAVRVVLVHQYGALFATVAAEITLTVTVDVESAYHPGPNNRRLPDTGVNRSAMQWYYQDNESYCSTR